MLYACPLCTQMLPSDAAFCRRCGGTVHFSRFEKSDNAKTGRSILTPVLVILLMGGISLAALVGFTVHTEIPSVQPAIALPQNYSGYTPPSAAYAPPQNVQIPLYVPAVQVPFYPVQPPVRYREAPLSHRR